MKNWPSNNKENTKEEPDFIKIPDNIVMPSESINTFIWFKKGILYDDLGPFNYVSKEEKDVLTESDKLKIRNWITTNFSPTTKGPLQKEDPRLYSIRGFWEEDIFGRYIKNYEVVLTIGIEAHERDNVKFPKGKNYFITLKAEGYFDYNEWLKNPQHIWNLGSTDKLNGMNECDVRKWLPKYLIQIERYPYSELSNFELIVVQPIIENSIQTRSYFICRKGVQFFVHEREQVTKRVGLDEFIQSN